MKQMLKISSMILMIILLSSCKTNEKIKNIQVYTRDTSSGTREAFFQAIDFKEASKDDSLLADQALIVDGNGDMINKIKNDINAIGYISLSTYKEKDLKALNVNNVSPSNENVLNGSYQLMRNFNYIITKNEVSKADRLAKAFKAYLSSLDAKLIIKAKGGIVDLDVPLLRWDEIKNNYPETQEDNSNITLRFGGSTSVEPIAKALSIDFSMKSGDPEIEHNYTGSSAAFKGTQGSEADGNDLLHVGFLSRNFNKDETAKNETAGILNYDAIAIVVNKINLLKNIDILNLKKIYNGKIKSFDEVTSNEVS